MTRNFQLFFICLFSMLSTGVAFAASPVAYVYVQQDGVFSQSNPPDSPISIFSVASDGKLTQVKGATMPHPRTDRWSGNHGTVDAGDPPS
jgi:hypothetical protein